MISSLATKGAARLIKLILPSLDKVSFILKGSPPITVFILYAKLIKNDIYPFFVVLPDE